MQVQVAGRLWFVVLNWISAGLRVAMCALVLLGVSQAAQAQTDYTKTKYPIVLVHGLFGFDRLGPIDYFWGVPNALTSGGATVYAASVSPSNFTEVRGEQLIKQLDQWKAVRGHQKFNLVGHSHGGNTIRYVAAVRPDLVASVSSVSTPHQGSKTADGIEAIAAGTGSTQLLANITNAFSALIAALSGAPAPQNSLGALTSLSTRGAQDFNRRFPQGAPTTNCGSGPAVVNGIRYYSMSGTSIATNVLDVSDAALVLTGTFFGFEQNDGLVSRCSSRWGTVLRDDYGWNHGDSANQVFGLRGLFSSDPIAVYRAHANRLKGLGL